jgi:hypothetical protein
VALSLNNLLGMLWTQRRLADDFTSFLQAYIARWAGRAGIL